MDINTLLTRRVDKIYPSREDLEKVLLSGKKLRLYLGIDPTATRLHLGHTVQLRKLQEFADLGHEAILLFGTGTVLVGDPSERDTTRQLISDEEIQKNIATWKDQVKPIIDFNKIKIKYNGDWLTKLSLKELIFIGSKISAVQLFKRDNFTRRIANGDTVWYYETLYPLMQGYDSVAMDVDLEIGGTDQTFNMLIGRELQEKINHKNKFVLTNKMIVGTDGKNMSKSSGNCIWLTDSPKDMFGKLMTVSDKLITQYFEFFTDIPTDKIAEIQAKINNGDNPMIYKKQLALAITKQFHGEQKAKISQEDFEATFQNKQLPADMATFSISKLSENPINPVDLLTQTSLCLSRSEAKRLLEQNGVRLNNETMKQFNNATIKTGDVIQVGKLRWLKFNE